LLKLDRPVGPVEPGTRHASGSGSAANRPTENQEKTAKAGSEPVKTGNPAGSPICTFLFLINIKLHLRITMKSKKQNIKLHLRSIHHYEKQ
jgi:hypothetical protein